MVTDVYQVVLNGNQVVYTSKDYNPAYLKALKFSRDHSDYVEVWFYDLDGSRSLVDYWN